MSASRLPAEPPSATSGGIAGFREGVSYPSCALNGQLANLICRLPPG
jgi:hypothetical protein